MIQIFDFLDYKSYLSSRFSETDKQRRVSRAALAKAIRCQPSYLTRIINGNAHLSLEQAHATSIFFQHTEDESHYFLLLVEWARAGTPSLKNHLEKFARTQREQILNLKKRLKIATVLSSEDQSRYYGSWHFAAVHACLGAPGFRTLKETSARLRISHKRVAEVTEFLVSTGLIQERSGKYAAGIARIHLGHDSPLIARHHLNWRLRAIESLENLNQQDLYYSSVICLSEADTLKIKAELVKAIERAKGIVRDSTEENVFCLALDLFRL